MKISKNSIFLKPFFIHGFLILITFFLFNSCKKEKENLVPTIIIHLPQSGISVNCVDSVFIDAEISDDNGPLTVKVYLADAQNNALTTPLVKSTEGNSISIEQLYFFNNKYIESGTYYLVFHVEDGKNQVNKFVEVNITGIPLTLTSVYVGVRNNSGLEIFCRDSGGNYNSNIIIPGTYVDFKINNFSQQLYILSSDGILSCYRLPSLEKDWDKIGFNVIGTAFRGQLMEYDFKIFVTDANGFIRSFDKDGILRNVYNLPSGNPQRFNFCNSELFVFSDNYQSLKKHILVFSLSGGLLNSYEVNFNAERFFEYSNNNIIVFGKNNTQTLMYTYNYKINYLYPFGNTINESYYDAAITPDNQYLLTTDNEIKVIEKYYGNSNIYALGQKSEKLLFEKTSNHLYLCDSNSLKSLNYPLTQVILINDFSDKILFVDFLYNK